MDGNDDRSNPKLSSVRRKFLKQTGAAVVMSLVPAAVRQAAWAAGSDAPEKTERLVIAPKQHVLPVVYQLARFAVAKGGRAATQLTARLEYDNALACFRAGADEVEVIYQFLERPDPIVAVSFDRSELPALEAELSEAIARINAGEFAPTPSEFVCSGCPALDLVCAGPRLRQHHEAPVEIAVG